MKEGAGACAKATGGGKHPDPAPPSVDETEAAVVRLPKDQREIVIQKHLYGGTNKQKAKKLGMGVELFKKKYESACSRIAGYLDAFQDAS